MVNYIDYTYSKDKGATKAGTKFASSINMGRSDKWYTSDQVKGENIGAYQAGVAINLPWTPVIPNSLILIDEDSGKTYGWNGTAFYGITGATSDINASGTNAVTPTSIAVTFATGKEPTGDLIVDYRFNNEDVRSDGYEWNGVNVGDSGYDPTNQRAGFTNVPEIQLNINSVPITAKARTLRSFWSFDAAYELQKEYGQDINYLVSNV